MLLQHPGDGGREFSVLRRSTGANMSWQAPWQALRAQWVYLCYAIMEAASVPKCLMAMGFGMAGSLVSRLLSVRRTPHSGIRIFPGCAIQANGLSAWAIPF